MTARATRVRAEVASLSPGSPLVGKLWPGDVVMLIDGESTTHMLPEEVQRRLDGAPDIEHSLLICAEKADALPPPPPAVRFGGAVGAPPGAEYGDAEKKHAGGAAVRVEVVADGAPARTAAAAAAMHSSSLMGARLSDFFKPTSDGGGSNSVEPVEDDKDAFMMFDETIDENALLPDPSDKAEFAAYCEMVTAQECLAVMARHAELEEAVDYLAKASFCDRETMERTRPRINVSFAAHGPNSILYCIATTTTVATYVTNTSTNDPPARAP